MVKPTLKRNVPCSDVAGICRSYVSYDKRIETTEPQGVPSPQEKSSCTSICLESTLPASFSQNLKLPYGKRQFLKSTLAL